MKRAHFLLALSLAFLPAFFVPTQVQAQQQCAPIFSMELPQSRTTLIDTLSDNKKVPAVLIPTRNGDIPVVLMNAKTGPLMRDFLASSIGTVVTHQPDWHNDHGLLRLDDLIADVDTPGSRNRGELHQTGISWVSLNDYLKRGGGQYIRVEVAYALTKAEIRIAKLYALMRRAAIIRVAFTFGGGNLKTDYPNFLKSGEHCFVYCSASGISSQISEIRSRFQAAGLGNLDVVLAIPDVRVWLEKVNEQLMTVDPTNASALSPMLPMRVATPDPIAQDPAFIAMTPIQKQEALNWLVGGSLSIAYMKLTNDLGFGSTGNGFSAMNNPRATAVLIYDGKVSAADFTSTNYTSKGIFSTWTNQNAKPLPEGEAKPTMLGTIRNFFQGK